MESSAATPLEAAVVTAGRALGAGDRRSGGVEEEVVGSIELIWFSQIWLEPLRLLILNQL